MVSTATAKTPLDQELENPPVEEQIRQLAYEIWLRHGGQDGSEMGDWLEAEAQILAEKDR